MEKSSFLYGYKTENDQIFDMIDKSMLSNGFTKHKHRLQGLLHRMLTTCDSGTHLMLLVSHLKYTKLYEVSKI